MRRKYDDKHGPVLAITFAYECRMQCTAAGLFFGVECDDRCGENEGLRVLLVA